MSPSLPSWKMPYHIDAYLVRYAVHEVRSSCRLHGRLLCCSHGGCQGSVPLDSCSPVAHPRRSLAAQVTIDNCTSSNYSVVSIVCKDRKGLIYDLMRTLKDIHVRVAYAKIKVAGDVAETDLFVEEADGRRVKERSALLSLAPRMPCKILRSNCCIAKRRDHRRWR